MNIDLLNLLDKPTLSTAPSIIRDSSIDSTFKTALPKNYRCTNPPYPKTMEGITTAGLESLNMSGSAQFSEGELIAIMKRLSSKTTFIVVDLREECHGFFNNDAISWLTPAGSNKDNIHKSYGEILDKERKLLLQKSLIHNGIVSTENDLCNKYSLSYLRLPITDNGIPSTFMVDSFLENLKGNLNEKKHVHFHCKAGRGRTSTLMIMYDIMHNSDKVSFKDILMRQAVLGSSNFLQKMQVKNEFRVNINDRVSFLNNFYQYCIKNSPNFVVSWKQWMENIN